jgi:hypothetical protein
MTKKCNPTSPNRKQTNISSFANTIIQNMQHSLQKMKSTYNSPAPGSFPRDLNKDIEDGFVSKLSDTASRLYAFEDQFHLVIEEITDTFEEFRQTQTEQREVLTTILKHLQLA